MGKYYITTTLPYVNAEPHIGFAMEIVRADVLARFHRLTGDEVFFNTGTDEHGQKIYEKAVEQGKKPQEYVDEYAEKFRQLKQLLDLSFDNFIRTTDEHHVRSAQEFWRRVDENGYIYKGQYKAKYCVGCELEKQDSELVDGKCPLHPTKELELIDEENYFFKFSAFEKPLLKLYDENPEFVLPENRLKEIRNFVAGGLKDFSISRPKAKLSWGVPVPGDEDHVFYVWFDALGSYISALGWPESEKFEEYWGTKEKPKAIQICGKDNLRQQSAMWQAMLMAAGLPNSKQVYVEGFITSGGQKISKSLGNVVDPIEYVNQYGVDALRYFLLAKLSPFDDGDFTREKFEEAYQADLANGLGNLVARVAAMCENSGLGFDPGKFVWGGRNDSITHSLKSYKYDEAIRNIWDDIKLADSVVNERKAWQLVGDERDEVLNELVFRIRKIGSDLQPFMPATAEKILKQFGGSRIVKGEGLFPRLK